MESDLENELARMRDEVAALKSRLAARDTVLRRAMEDKGKALLEQLVRSYEIASTTAEAARRDAHTGLVRHGVFRTRLEFECDRSKRTGDALGLLLVDIDRFAALNELHGYDAGDRALGRVAAALQACTQPGARPLVLGREAGSRFGVILPGARADETATRAEAMRACIEQLTLPHRLTASVGAVSWSPDRDGKALVRDAARAVERAKHEGGNRVVVA